MGRKKEIPEMMLSKMSRRAEKLPGFSYYSLFLQMGDDTGHYVFAHGVDKEDEECYGAFIRMCRRRGKNPSRFIIEGGGNVVIHDDGVIEFSGESEVYGKFDVPTVRDIAERYATAHEAVREVLVS